MTSPIFFTPSGAQRQQEIYRAGLAGKTPAQPIALEGLAEQARQKLPAEAFDYLAGGAGGEDTMRANLEAFRRWRIVPRFLRNVARRDLSLELFGRRLPAPVLLAPIGVLGIIHHDGELSVARAARTLGIPMILSTLSSQPLEAVAKESGDGPRWFQLYWPNNPDLAASWLSRAERAGFNALVVTLDTFHLAWRERDLQHAYLPFLRGEGLANYVSDPVFKAAIGGEPHLHPVKTVEHFGQVFSNPALTWADLAFLRQHWRQPILLKGVLHPDDARRAREHGMDGVIVSNHGGRQVDGAIAALDALPGVVDAVGRQVAVLFDSGIRRGADVFKALALGARAVLLGRPYCYGLAINGEEGVRDVVQNLLADFDLTVGLAGCASLKELDRSTLAPDENKPLG
jgi:isopentenyl diphosphate isomerase/L-lactate dehydrogenase-like FMN-dependent dehydrogenase